MGMDSPSRTRTTVVGTRINFHKGKTRAPIRVRIRAHVATPIPRAPTPILNQVTTMGLGPRTRRFNRRSCNQ
jgi:hypothetical protein